MPRVMLGRTMRGLLLLFWVAAQLAVAKQRPDFALQTKVLGEIADRTAQVAASGKKPAAAFDIDDTLLLTAPRTKAILLEFAAKHADAYPGMQEAVTKLVPEEMPRGIAAAIQMIGITDPDKSKTIKAYWAPRFLSGDYLTHDWAMPGALAFVERLRKAGAVIYYVTARPTDTMQAGTEKALRHFGFPLDDRAKLVMNGGRNYAPTFKGKVMTDLLRDYVLTGLFENEPDNLNAMHRAAPAASAVFIDTVFTTGAQPLDKGIPSLRDYRVTVGK